MKAVVELQKNVNFKATSGTGHTIQMDGAEQYGGENMGARPMEVLLIGMGGCASFDVVHILRKRRLEVTGCVAELDAERAETDPKVFTKIHLHFKVSGTGLTDKAVAKAVQLSAEKYCSASIMLGKTATITHSHEIIE
ncbi:OsmC family protein [Arenicella xantha]|uniref:Putative redox protein n=1 Tax=Arenicella xantha TaxID=644221 RepID=A0A395JSE6_9GAMM|nr:OsmC family protein [Arenicella xantha]RBP53386.1 putative redox protein [Arenicella xantha]